MQDNTTIQTSLQMVMSEVQGTLVEVAVTGSQWHCMCLDGHIYSMLVGAEVNPWNRDARRLAVSDIHGDFESTVCEALA